MLPKILVVGGAGYIGSHMVKMLLEEKYTVTVLDNLSTGHRNSVPSENLIVGDVGDAALLSGIFEKNQYDAVINFASFIDVAESITNPRKYYENNLGSTLVMLREMQNFGVDKLVFSSSAAVYGKTMRAPIKETQPKNPISPYGKCKWMIEQVLEDYSAAYGLKAISLRYFNCAGADPDGSLMERHYPETHLIPILLQVALARNQKFYINGSDYNTPDGTCIRDYVHVRDICRGHLQALNHLLAGGASGTFNLGSGSGTSILEVIHAVETITEKEVNFSYVDRRQGDPDILVAEISAARTTLNWSPEFSDLKTIIYHAWNALRKSQQLLTRRT